MTDADLFGPKGDPFADRLLTNLRKLKEIMGEGAHTMPPPGTVHDFTSAMDTMGEWLQGHAGASATCEECQAEIYFLRTPQGKKLPVTVEGEPHFANCTKPERFRKP